MRILITGDIAVIKPYDVSTHIGNNVRNLFENSDLNIVNLEAPVTNSLKEILKTGPNLKSDKRSLLDVFKTLKVDVVTLANNHLMDYGEEGVADTLQFCNEHDVKTVGGGMDIKEASQTLYMDSEEGKIAIVNFAENEWVAATETSAGFNPMDVIDNANQIKEAKKKADHIIVIIHGGHEYYNLPSPRMVKQYRFYAEQGADIVVGHHTHCISGNEVHKGVPIYYNLGNFLFTKDSVYEDWYSGLVLEVNIKDKELKPNLIPIRQDKNNYNLTLTTENEKNRIFKKIEKLNATIKNEESLRQEWCNFIKLKTDDYLFTWAVNSSINNRFIRAGLRKINLKIFNKQAIAKKLNMVRCEAHRDLSNEILNKYIQK